MNKYDHKIIESKWQKHWREGGLYKTDLDASKKPFYNLMMFPYPSAEGLHIGSVYTFSGIDTYGRFKRMRGYNVFEPFGLDGFGIHSENYAIKIKENILDVSKRTEKHYYEQMQRTGMMIDWSRKLETFEPGYYKWTQWLFIQFFKAGLAYRKEADVNWCPSCKTVLSDEQVIDGKCERCGTTVEKKSMNQWFFRITDFSERLLKNLDNIDWVEDVKTGQRNWIGKSEGAEISFSLRLNGKEIQQDMKVYTTAHDTLPGCTFMVLAPEHSLLEKYSHEFGNSEEIVKYRKEALKKQELERQIAKEKTGIKIDGLEAIHPLTGKSLPVFVADYVIASYGTGAIMAVPGHDQRDYDFAKTQGLEVIFLVKDRQELVEYSEIKENPGKFLLVNSGEFDGMDFKTARSEVIKKLKKAGIGQEKIQYKLRDWCVSRQRYWGPPIPMIYCDSCEKRQDGYFEKNMPGWWPDEELPILLPEIKEFKDTLPDGSGKGPLAKFPNFYKTKCPHCKKDAIRETDVSDPFVDSCWYFLRYPFTEYDEIPFGGNFFNDKSLFNPKISEKEQEKVIKRMEKWGPVTSYIGGKEHTVLHLLYARFITMAFHDMGYLEFEEPFTRFYGHGLITKDGAKMSKSKGNVINPDEYFDKYGADAVRMYLRFMGPFDQGGDWSDKGMQGMYKFVMKIWRNYQELIDKNTDDNSGEEIDAGKLDQTINKITEDLENLKFNTSIAEIMKFFNWYGDIHEKMPHKQKIEILTKMLKVLSVFMPHMSEELWHILGKTDSVHSQKWPEIDREKLEHDTVELAVQINGKTRGSLIVTADATQEEILNKVLKEDFAKRHLGSEKPSRVIYVKGKIINLLD